MFFLYFSLWMIGICQSLLLTLKIDLRLDL